MGREDQRGLPNREEQGRLTSSTGISPRKRRNIYAQSDHKRAGGPVRPAGLERVLYSKYQTAVQETTDQELKTCFQNLAGQHQQNYTCLLKYLH